MDPTQTKLETVQILQEAILRMTSPEFELALLEQPDDVVKNAKRERARVQMARVILENTQLAAIRDRLVANETELREGRRRVNEAIQNLQQVQDVLGAISSFVDLVGRVVALV